MKVISCKKNSGLTIIELVIAVGILVLFLVSITASYSLLLRLAFLNILKVKGTFLAEETVEVLRFMKIVDWQQNIAPLSSNTDYFLNFDEGNWQISESYFLVDSVFERKFVLEDVYRDSYGAITESGGSLDSGTKKLDVYVSWSSSGFATTTKSISTYISNLQ